jgi:hypothetical protein
MVKGNRVVSESPEEDEVKTLNPRRKKKSSKKKNK